MARVAGEIGGDKFGGSSAGILHVRGIKPAELRSAWTGEGARPHTTFPTRFYFSKASLFTTYGILVMSPP